MASKERLVRMVCSICRQNRCRASSCNSDILQQAVARIKAYWLGENMPEGWTDQLIRNRATTERIGLPFWRRIWSVLNEEIHRRGWSRIPRGEALANPVIAFLRPPPRSIQEFVGRIRHYERPAELPVAPPRPQPRPQFRPLPRPQQPDFNLEREMRFLHNQIDQAMVLHRRRINQGFQQQQANRKKVSLVMDTTESDDYFVDPTCPICMEDITPQTVLAFGCKHTLCGNCTLGAIQKTNVGCPICRAPIEQVRFKPNTAPETFNKVSSQLSLS